VRCEPLDRRNYRNALRGEMIAVMRFS